MTVASIRKPSRWRFRAKSPLADSPRPATLPPPDDSRQRGLRYSCGCFRVSPWYQRRDLVILEDLAELLHHLIGFQIRHDLSEIERSGYIAVFGLCCHKDYFLSSRFVIPSKFTQAVTRSRYTIVDRCVASSASTFASAASQYLTGLPIKPRLLAR